MDRPARAVVQGEDDEDSGDDGHAEQRRGEEGGEEADTVQEAERETGTQAPPVAGVHAGTARPARRRVALTQNQLKLSARLDSTQRKLRSTIRSRNEKALAQLRGAGACLQRATVAVQNAKRTADAALEELASRLQVPSGLSSPKAGDAKTSAAL